MNYRKRFMDTMLFKDNTCVPFHEIALWQQTIVRWEHEGMPKGVTDGSFFEGNVFFGFEPREFIRIEAASPMPEVEYKVIEEDERTITFIDSSGITQKTIKNGTVNNSSSSMNQYISFPVCDRASFNKWKNRFKSDGMDRYPCRWSDLIIKWNNRRSPLCLLGNGQFGFYSMMRRWLGTEGVSYIFYDDPDLAHEILDFLAEYLIDLIHKAVNEIDIDYFNFFEDMSFKTGPLISPEIFKTFFMPRYKKVIEYMRSYGIKLIIVDTDGNPMKILPLFIEAGVNGFWPIEVAAGIDPIIVRKEFGNDLALIGGIDKRILTGNKRDIREELLRIFDYMLPRGGYIPTIDHSVPPDVSLENFMYYLDIKKRAIQGYPI